MFDDAHDDKATGEARKRFLLEKNCANKAAPAAPTIRPGGESRIRRFQHSLAAPRPRKRQRTDAAPTPHPNAPLIHKLRAIADSYTDVPPVDYGRKRRAIAYNTSADHVRDEQTPTPITTQADVQRWSKKKGIGKSTLAVMLEFVADNYGD